MGLVITRRDGESVIIRDLDTGDTIEIMASMTHRNNQVRLSIVAPQKYNIIRKELKERDKHEAKFKDFNVALKP